MRWAPILRRAACRISSASTSPLGVRAHPTRTGLREGRFEVADWLWRNSGETTGRAGRSDRLLRADGATFWTMKDFAAAWKG